MQAFLGGIVLKTLQVHELFLTGEDSWQNSYSYRANQAKDEFSIRDIDPKRTTVQKMVLIAWAQKEDCLTLKQDLIKRERQMRGVSGTERRIETQRQPESTEKPIIQLLDYTPKHPTPEYQVATEVIKKFYDPIPEGGKPTKAFVIQDFIAQRLEEITGVKPPENAITRIDALARSPDFKNQTKTKNSSTIKQLNINILRTVKPLFSINGLTVFLLPNPRLCLAEYPHVQQAAKAFFMQQQFITVKDVTAIYGVSRTTVWNWTNPKHKQYRPDFPKRYKLGGNTARWKASEIQAHIDGMKHKEGE